MGSRFAKEPKFYSGMSFPRASLGMLDPAEHKIRRRVLAPAFTHDGVLSHAQWIELKVEQLCDRFGSLADSEVPINLNKAFKSLTTDIISKIVLGQEFGVLDAPDFDDPRLHILQETIRKSWTYRGFPITFAILMSLPEFVMQRIFDIPILQIAKVSGHYSSSPELTESSGMSRENRSIHGAENQCVVRGIRQINDH